MKRGAIVTAALTGDFGKPRPVLVVQAEVFNEGHPSVTVLPITSTILDAPTCRVTLEASAANGLVRISQVMVDKAATIPRAKVGRVIGQADDDSLIQVTRTLAVWLGIA